MRSLANLVDIYFSSVGSNSVLLLNIPPDRRGLIHEIDAQRLEDFSLYISHTFEESLLKENVSPWHAAEGDSVEYEVI